MPHPAADWPTSATFARRHRRAMWMLRVTYAAGFAAMLAITASLMGALEP